MNKNSIFIIGDFNGNTGPANVNKKIINNSNEFKYIKSSNRFLKKIELLINLFMCKVIIISGIGENAYYICKISKLLRKKVIYLMHGNVKRENEINKLNLDDKIIHLENKILNNVDLILCVSRLFKNDMLKQYPNIKNKIYYINNGVDKTLKTNAINANNSKNKEKIKIAVSGGNRGTKNNSDICKAVEKMRSMGYDIQLNIYGRIYKNNENINFNENIILHEHLEQDEFYKELEKANLFILNSEFEPFGLSLIEALQCGCNVLISKSVGALSIMETNEMDIINDPHNINEIVEKIIYVQKNHNNERIMKSINFEINSWESYCKKMVNICEFVIKNDYSFIVEE